MRKHAFWTASFQCLGKSLSVPVLDLTKRRKSMKFSQINWKENKQNSFPEYKILNYVFVVNIITLCPQIMDAFLIQRHRVFVCK